MSRSRSGVLHGAGATAVCVVLAGLAGACAVAGEDTEGSGPQSFAEAKRRLAQLVDLTVDAALRGREGKRLGPPTVPCRSAGGSGPATGEHHPTVGLGYKLDRGEDERALLERVKRHWEGQGYIVRSENLDREDPTIYGTIDGGYGLSFTVQRTTRVAVLDGSGPCRKPASEQDRDSPPALRSAQV